jgi:hypothetical protein
MTDLPIQPSAAAIILGVSKRQIYDLAAPGGPIPCFRIGKRIVFDAKDLQEYKESCRFTKTRTEVVTSYLRIIPALRAAWNL